MNFVRIAFVTSVGNQKDELETVEPASRGWSEDWLAVAVRWLLLLVSFFAVTLQTETGADGQTVVTGVDRIGDWFGKTGGWVDSPLEALKSKAGEWVWPGMLGSAGSDQRG